MLRQNAATSLRLWMTLPSGKIAPLTGSVFLAPVVPVGIFAAPLNWRPLSWRSERFGVTALNVAPARKPDPFTLPNTVVKVTNYRAPG